MEQEEKKLQKVTDFADKSLLIVDDDNPLRDRLARAMEKKGFQVIQAENVDKGINLAKTSPPAFAVVDLRLTDGSGLEVVKEIRKNKKDSRIIMLTGYGNIPTAVAAVKAGAIDWDDMFEALLDRYKFGDQKYYYCFFSAGFLHGIPTENPKICHFFGHQN